MRRWVLAVLGTATILLPMSARSAEISPAPPAADAAATPTAGTDVVITTAGDSLRGTVLGIDSAGRLRMSGPTFAGEVKVLADAVDRIILAGAGDDGKERPDGIALAGGDFASGTLETITEESAVINTPLAGRLKIAPAAVTNVAFGRHGDVIGNILLDTNFITGRLAPWTAKVPQSWTLTDGALVGRSGGSSWVYAQVDQKEAVTILAKAAAIDGNPFWLDLCLYSDDTNLSNCLTASFRGSLMYLRQYTNRSLRTISNRRLQPAANAGVVRLAYDPAAGKAHLWMGEVDAGEYGISVKLASGNYVAFDTGGAIKIEYVRVLRGIVPPSGADAAPAGEAADGKFRVRFANGDTLTATKVALADGRMTLTTEHGGLQCAATAVADVAFPPGGAPAARPELPYVEVLANGLRMTLRLDLLTAEHLIGRSAAWGGEVRLKRSAIREIRFVRDKSP